MLELFRVLGLESAEAFCGEEMLLEGDQWWKYDAARDTGPWTTGPWLFVFGTLFAYSYFYFSYSYSYYYRTSLERRVAGAGE